MMKIEAFSARKLIGVLASLSGVILISLVDLTGDGNDDGRGNFPHKTQAQIAIGDAMALFSAIVYGIYVVVMKLNSLSSFISDISWAYAMLLTTPLVVTVGLSLNIPVSLVGEMVQYEQYSSFVYWVGAVIVVISFLFINHESHGDGEDAKTVDSDTGL
ncbi:hypothetical protein ONZ43_g7588 [Nemania bipapillata]|uniref:Uncharacterized protein n=1 Tax=Nemania bipapillata TaxID=110536 RepID=A0ACC2HPP5_9PEZI|nr:hypothetical protein ONZ43_g7588 [Nemania bipapillata]